MKRKNTNINNKSNTYENIINKMNDSPENQNLNIKINDIETSKNRLSRRKSSPASVDSNGKLNRKFSTGNVLLDLSHKNSQTGHISMKQYIFFIGVVIMTVYSINFLVTIDSESDAASLFKNKPLHYQVLLVWSAGWMTCVSTGFGALPFIFFGNLSPNTIAICNSIASGMMTAASIGLASEGCMGESSPGDFLIPPLKTLIGIYIGAGFVRFTENYFDDVNPIEIIGKTAGDSKRVILIMIVMTLHSASEGIGIGASFHTETLGGFVSATLAIHNIPEGIAIAIVLFPNGFSVLSIFLWCVFSSLPQPLMAVPAFLFTNYFEFIFPICLGIAAGAMMYVTVSELIPEATEAIGNQAYVIALLSMIMMGGFQFVLRQNESLF